MNKEILKRFKLKFQNHEMTGSFALFTHFKKLLLPRFSSIQIFFAVIKDLDYFTHSQCSAKELKPVLLVENCFALFCL